jgi:hypothetical protein
MRKTQNTSKTKLQNRIDEANGLLEEAYTPETTREDLAAAVGQALDILKGEDGDDDDDGED